MNNENTTPATEEQKTFTQEDVNRIVSERLAKEKTKLDTALAEREKTLTQRELALTAKERLRASGLPGSLIDALNMSDSDALEKSLKIVETEFAGNKPAPLSGSMGFNRGGMLAPDIKSDSDVRTAMGLNPVKRGGDPEFFVSSNLKAYDSVKSEADYFLK